MPIGMLKDRRRAQTTVVACGAVLVLAFALAFAVDVGYLGVARARLQNVADASCLAAAETLFNARLSGEDEVSARQSALAEAQRLQQANWNAAGLEVEFGYMDENGAFVCADESTRATAVRCSASRDSEAPGGRVGMLFGTMLGVDSVQSEATATAQISASIYGILAGLRPFAIPEGAVGAPGQVMTFYPASPDDYEEGLGEDQVAPGCWGLLNLDGGSLGTDELQEWIENGFNGSVIISSEGGAIWFDGTSGFRAAIQGSIRDMIGETCYMVVYDAVEGEGSNADFRCVGFIRATITSCRLTGRDPYIECRIAERSTLHDVLAGRGMESSNIRKVQLVQ